MKINTHKVFICVFVMFLLLGNVWAQIQVPGNYNASDNSNHQKQTIHIPESSPKTTLLSESFNSTTFPPAGWLSEAGSGTYTWSRVTAGTYPVCAPHSGSGMAGYNSYFASTGFYATLTSKAVNLTGNTGFYIVKMWMYHDNDFSYDNDRVAIYVNTAPNLNSAVLVGTVSRYNAVESWTEHTFVIPAAFNTATNYFIFKAISGFGNDIYVDDISVISDVKDFGITSIVYPEVGMLPGTVVPQVNIKNYGSFAQSDVPVSYKIGTNGTVNTVTVPFLAAGGTTSVSFPAWTADLGVYDFIFYTNLTGDDILGNDTLKRTLSVLPKLNKAYCFKDNSQPSSFLLENPIGGFTNMGVPVPWVSRAGVYFSTSETGYKWLVLGSDKYLYSMDTLGIANFVGATGVADQFLTGLTYDKSSHILYASGLSGNYPNFTFKLYTLNQANGIATLVATSSRQGFFTDIACTTYGQLYAIEYRPDSTGRFYSLDKTTAALTLIGTNMGARISSNPQDIEFTDNNVLYFTASMGNDGVLDGLYTINTQTGKATLVSTFKTANTPVTGFGIKTAYGASVPDQKNDNNNIQILPNPGKDFISVISKNNNIIKTIKVYSLSGKMVFSDNVNHIATTLNITDWKSGFYFVQVHTDAGVYTQKIVVAK